MRSKLTSFFPIWRQLSTKTCSNCFNWEKGLLKVNKTNVSSNVSVGHYSVLKDTLSLQCNTSLLFSHPNRFLSTTSVRSRSSSSSVEDDPFGQEVYYGSLERTLKYVKVFSLTNSAFVLAAIPYMLHSSLEKLVKYKVAGAFVVTCGAAVGILIPIFLHNLSRRYVTNIYYNFDTKLFTLTYYSLFLRRKHVTFSSDDVTIPLTASYSTHLIKNKPYFIMKQYFYTNEMYAKLLGVENN